MAAFRNRWHLMIRTTLSNLLLVELFSAFVDAQQQTIKRNCNFNCIPQYLGKYAFDVNKSNRFFGYHVHVCMHTEIHNGRSAYGGKYTNNYCWALFGNVDSNVSGSLHGGSNSVTILLIWILLVPPFFSHSIHPFFQLRFILLCCASKHPITRSCQPLSMHGISIRTLSTSVQTIT